MRRGLIALGCAGVAGIAMLAANKAGEAQGAAAGPKARYWIDASTVSGMGAGMNAMAMLTGRGGGAQHSLWMRLGSTLAPSGGAAKADHFVPQGLGLGTSVPLETRGGTGSDAPGGYERPRGRLRIFWGCGDHVGPGQPVEIDFAKVAAGQFPPNFWSVNVPVEQGPTRGTSRTFGDWPNAMQRDRKMLKPGASLIGQHRIAGNYSPEISFALQQDFLPPVQLRSRAAPMGGVALNWQPVAGATGFYAMGIGGMGQGGRDSLDLVWWGSSASREFGGGLQDYLSPGTVEKLIARKIVMPPSQTACTVPAEVKAAAGEMLMVTMTAFGPEANFAYPPRPADPKIAWRPEWSAKVRFKSQAMAIAGLDMGAMMGGADDAQGADNGGQAPKACKKKRGLGGIGGMLGGALGVPSGC